MTGRTFVLMRSSKNELNSVMRLLNRLPGVECVTRLQGPYDLVAQFGPGSGDTVTTLSDLPGVDRIVVCSSLVA